MPLNADATIDGRSLQQFLSVTREELAAKLDAKTLVAAANDNANQFTSWMHQANWPHLSDEVAGHVCGFLQENVVTIFAGAWTKYAELKKLAHETKAATGTTATAGLADHDFTYELKPAIKILLNGIQAAEIEFTIALTCTVTGLELSLKDGAVAEVRSGRCDAKSEIQCAGAKVWDRALAGIHLPGELHLTHPVVLVA